MRVSHALKIIFCLGLGALPLLAAPPALRPGDPEVDARLTSLVKAHRELGRDLDERHVLRTVRQEADSTGVAYTRAQQYFQGVRVLGGELVLRSGGSGALDATADRLVRDLYVHTVPGLDVEGALAIAHAHFAPRDGYTLAPTAELVIYPVTRLLPRPGVKHPANAEDFEEVLIGHELAYLVHAEIEQDADTRHESLLLQAHSGGLLKRWSTLHTAAQTGTGKSEYSGTVTLSTNSVAAGYELRDPRRSNNFTVNMGGATSGSGTIYTSSVDTWGDGTNFGGSSSGSSISGQTAAVDAHYGMQTTWDFYKAVLGRNGIDGTGRTVNSRVHYGTKYDNAFWSDATFSMTYGDGNVFKTLTALDVAGHEMSHGVCSSTANLAYYGESGGLNEANSDILGTMVEFYARGAQAQGATVPDTGGNWTIGEQLSTPSFPNPLRYMYKPSLDGQSPDAWSATLANLDVHLSSGPMNRAFYFLSQGSAAVASNVAYSPYLPTGMKGLGNDKALRIWWRTLTTRLTSTSNYLAARNGAIAAASELYGASGSEVAAVWNAFAAINVGSPWKPADTTAPAVSAKVAGTSGTLTFTATATDNVGVTRVDYWVNGALKGSATTAPYSFAFLSTALANGSHSLVAKASDAAGNVGTSATVTFAVSNDVTAPTVSTKVAGTSGTLTFTATATDNVGVTRVDYYVDGTLKGSATTSPYSFAFVSTALANGSHTLVAKAYDAAGNVGTSATLAFSLNNAKDTTAPIVSAKVAGTSGTLTFTATATDNVGVTRVDYWVNGALKGSATTAPYSFAFLSTALANGSHSLVAKASDAAGNVGTSATVTFAVSNDLTAPTVSAKVAGTSGTLTFTATATDNVGVTRVDYYVDGALKGNASTAPYSFAFLSSALANGNHALVAKAYDAAGNVGTSATVTFAISNAPPSTTLYETESNDTVATANVIGSGITTVIGAIATGSDVDTFALTLVSGQSVTLTLTPPAGMIYGIRPVQGLMAQGLRIGTTASVAQTLTLQAPAHTVAQLTVYFQVFSYTGQGSSSKYTIAIQR
jgi:Zn-dependent metalloprotease